MTIALVNAYTDDEKSKLGNIHDVVPKASFIRSSNHSVTNSESYIPYESIVNNHLISLTAEGWIEISESGYYYGNLNFYIQEIGDPEVCIWLEKKPLSTGVWELLTGSLIIVKLKSSGGKSLSFDGGIEATSGDLYRVKICADAGTSTLVTQNKVVTLGTVTQYAATATIYRAGGI